jgi:hypothetical protein
VSSIHHAQIMRRIEFAFARAVRTAQERGIVSSKHYQSGLPVTQYLPSTGGHGWFYRLMESTPEQFEAALKNALDKTGSLTQAVVCAELRALMAEQGAKPVTLRVVPTKRGERLIQGLALTASSLAATCREVNPGEVDGAAFRDLVQGAREDVGVIRGFLKRVGIDGDDGE